MQKVLAAIILALGTYLLASTVRTILREFGWEVKVLPVSTKAQLTTGVPILQQQLAHPALGERCRRGVSTSRQAITCCDKTFACNSNKSSIPCTRCVHTNLAAKPELIC
jgi:hypothetical protein